MNLIATPPDGECRIRVGIRMRPCSDRAAWKVCPEDASVTLLDSSSSSAAAPSHGSTTAADLRFSFDSVFDETASTAGVYRTMAEQVVRGCLEGTNGTIFAYGQTSSGKTFTMQGASSLGDADGAGIVHLAARDLFEGGENGEEGRTTRQFHASVLEIYNEDVRDLLSPVPTRVLAIRQDGKAGISIPCVERQVGSTKELLECWADGEQVRSVAATGMNERSSRSHTLFRIRIETTGQSQDDTITGQSTHCATLHLVDLAGSESVRHTGASGDRQKEAGKINQSLLTLSRVISSLGSKNKMSHVNFRDSKLTRILQPALSGNANTAVICCATPSHKFMEETRSTLHFASRAKIVKTNAKINVVMDDRALVHQLLLQSQNETKQVKFELAAAEAKAADAQLQLESLKKSMRQPIEVSRSKENTTVMRPWDWADGDGLVMRTSDQKTGAKQRSRPSMTEPRPNKRTKHGFMPQGIAWIKSALNFQTKIAPEPAQDNGTPPIDNFKENSRRTNVLREKDMKALSPLPKAPLSVQEIPPGISIEMMKQQIDTLAGQVAKHNEEAAVLVNQMEERDSTMSVLKAQVESLKEQEAANERQIDTLSGQVAKRDEEAAVRENQMQERDSTISELKTQVEALKKQEAAMKRLIDTVAGLVAKRDEEAPVRLNQMQVDRFNGEIKKLRAEIKELEGKLLALQAQAVVPYQPPLQQQRPYQSHQPTDAGLVGHFRQNDLLPFQQLPQGQPHSRSHPPQMYASDVGTPLLQQAASQSHFQGQHHGALSNPGMNPGFHSNFLPQPGQQVLYQPQYQGQHHGALPNPGMAPQIGQPLPGQQVVSQSQSQPQRQLVDPMSDPFAFSPQHAISAKPIARVKPFKCPYCRFSSAKTELPESALWEGAKKTPRDPYTKHCGGPLKHFVWCLHMVRQKRNSFWDVERVGAHIFGKVLDLKMPRIQLEAVKSVEHLCTAVADLERDIPLMFLHIRKHSQKFSCTNAKGEFLLQDYEVAPVKVGRRLKNIQFYAMRILECYRQRIESPGFMESILRMEPWQILNSFYIPLCTVKNYEELEYPNPFIDRTTMIALRESKNFLEAPDIQVIPDLGKIVGRVPLPDGFQQGRAPSNYFDTTGDVQDKAPEGSDV